MVSTFRSAIDFFVSIGLYDVILPFLLVFTLMFAFLEKTKVLGFDIIKDPMLDEKIKVPKKSLNSMVAFVTGLLVVLSAQLVSIINEILANVVLLIILSFLFLLVIGSFMNVKEEGVAFSPSDNPFMYWSLLSISFVVIILIFLQAIKTKAGKSWLQIILDSAKNAVGNEFWSVLILLIVLIGGIALVIGGSPKRGSPKKED